MLRPVFVLLILATIVAAALGIGALGFVDLPVPTHRVEKVIPHERLAR
jgi:hypothetical protein